MEFAKVAVSGERYSESIVEFKNGLCSASIEKAIERSATERLQQEQKQNGEQSSELESGAG